MSSATLLTWQAVALWLALAAGPPVSPASDRDVDQEVGRLGSDQLAERQAAMTRLEAIGEPALKALRKAVAAAPDVDVRLRAAVVIRAIEKGLLAPVRLFEGHEA